MEKGEVENLPRCFQSNVPMVANGESASNVLQWPHFVLTRVLARASKFATSLAGWLLCFSPNPLLTVSCRKISWQSCGLAGFSLHSFHPARNHAGNCKRSALQIFASRRCRLRSGELHKPDSEVVQRYHSAFCLHIPRLQARGKTFKHSIAEPGDAMATKIMVVGDSISHGREGDWTWRYRIWEWFRQEGVAVRFVGPYKGTLPPDEPEPPRPPPLQSEAPRPGIPRSDGGYAQGVSPAFLEDCCHFAFGGRQAMQTKTMIAEQIAAYQPDLCLVELGFNDIAWCVSGPQDTLDSMERLVGAARSAKPDLQFAIANVPHRTLLPGREDIPFNTNVYNTLLARAIPAWSSPESPIALVRFCENYSCESCSFSPQHRQLTAT